MADERRTHKPDKGSCGLCESPDNEEMVQCDSCDKWFHFACTGTSSEIEDKEWLCPSCTQQKSVGDSAKRQPSVKSKTSSKRREVQLQLLEEERALQEKRDAEYLRKKMAVLMEDDSSSDEEVRTFSPDKHIKALEQATNSTEVAKEKLAIKKQKERNKVYVSEQKTLAKAGYSWSGVVNQIKIATDNSQQQKPYPTEADSLSKNQIAARQSLARELPIFSGNPEEWPLFISSLENSTRLCGFSNDENLLRLQRCLKGSALDLVRSRLLLPSNVPAILTTLRMMYGRPEIIIHSLLMKVRNEPAPRADKLESIITFALAVQNMCATIEASGLHDHLNNPVLLQEIVDKLPAQIKLNWAIFKRTLSFVNLSSISVWLFELAETVSNVTFTPSYFLNEKRPTKGKANINVHAELSNKNTSSQNLHKCKLCNQECSRLEQCQKFIKMGLNDKWTTVKRLLLCRTCLVAHINTRCSLDKLCGVDGCKYRHHALLHKHKENTEQASTTPTTSATTSAHNCHANVESRNSILYRIVPVVMYNDYKKIQTFAFLDEGSDLTLMDSSLAAELNLKGKKDPLHLQWTGQTHRWENDSEIISAEISAASGVKKFMLRNIRTVKSLDLPEQSLHASDLASKHSHLRGVPLISYKQAIPRILIGLNNWKLGFPLKAIEGNEDEPAATKTRLGWVVYGGSGVRQFENYNFHICECEKKSESLHNMMKEYFSLDSLGVTTSIKNAKPVEEERASKMLEANTIRKGERFETQLLWKYDHFELPNSFPMALRRFECFRKKLHKDPILSNNLQLQMENYLSKKYIRKLTDDELRKNIARVWYLPVFTVANINKSGKIRMVWDAAAQVDGVSLNSLLMKGPDQLISLPSILFRFRERAVAISGDIREMFHKVMVREEDQHVQRFLWCQNNTQPEPDVYVMQVLTFGATCSPSCAQFVMNKNAQEYESQFPRAAKCIIQNHYVDDLLDSVDSEDEAIKLAKEVKYIHSKAGFEIRNWISNCSKVNDELEGENQEAVNLSNNPEAESTERVLGMWWSTSSDSFTYLLSPKASVQQLVYNDVHPTKRQVLRMMMTIFDPLGLIAHFIVYIKILMQEIWRSGIGWDDPIGDNHFNKWCTWVRELKSIHQIKIPRCYLTNFRFGEHDNVQLHVFTDASENAFAAVAYFRVTKGSEIECSLIASKTRVAPLKMASIPRLELEAARLGARLARSITQRHSIQISQQVFWTDSRTVLCWIQSDHRKYRQFVAFRVSEILDMTEMQQWRYVPSKLNVADDGTKWTSTSDFTSTSRWILGPTFLRETEEMWPKKISNRETTDEEQRAHVLYHSKVMPNIIQFERFSKWKRLVRTQVYVMRFIWNLSATKLNVPRREGVITKDEYTEAENCLYRQAQANHFRDEIAVLQFNKDLPIENKRQSEKASPLYKLSPYMDDFGVLRVQGRIDATPGVTMDVKRPIILPKGHPVTLLAVHSYHLLYHHQNNETVINEVRRKYSIPQLRVILKKVKRECQLCKNQRAMPTPPEMAQLPTARLAAFTRPFSFIGVDYFGPMTVAIGRRNEKRWGVLITCLTTRAIHIEVANSLTSDSCILAMKRFIARRGIPTEIRSDNGTNFHGADRVLKEAVFKQNIKLAEEFSSSTTRWVFNPPAAPHMGGSWERLVRSVKTVLYQILPTRNPTDELLHSMLLEVERTINSRPLTYLPLDEEGDEALTPNHFLLGPSSGQKPDGIITDDGVLMRANWMRSQQFANSFWRRWVREYLPTLTRRTKWHHQVKPIEKGDIVIIVDETSSRNLWPKGRVVDVTKGSEGQVRRAIIQTPTGIFERPAVKIAVLDVRRNGRSDGESDIPGGSVGNAA